VTSLSRESTDAGPGRPLWLLVLAVGVPLWIAAVVVGLVTRDLVLVSPAIIIGSALVPTACTMAAFGLVRRRDGRATRVTTATLLAAFLPGGVLALILSITLDVWFVDLPAGVLLPIVAVAETLGQLLVIVAIASRLDVRRPRDGMVVGAAVGFGFAAFETAGLAIARIAGHGVDPIVLIQELVLRAVLSPFGHGLWAALVGGAVFAAAARRGALRPDVRVLGWFALAALLHLAWDLASNVGAVVAALVTGAPVTWADFDDAWVADATVRQAGIQNGVTIGVLVVVAGVGALLAARMWRRAIEATPAP
jgi:protease PrsW